MLDNLYANPVVKQLFDDRSFSPSLNQSNDKVEYVPLPSKGIYYKGPFKGMDKLLCRYINWSDEDILTTESFYENGELFQFLLNRIIVDPNNFKAQDLVPIDKDAILYWLRIGTFGRNYEVTRENPRKLGDKQKITWDLGETMISDFPSQHETELMETGEATLFLPDTKATVKISVASIGKEAQIEKALKVKKEKEKLSNDLLITGRLMAALVEVPDMNGVPTRDSNHISSFLLNQMKSIIDSRLIYNTYKQIALETINKVDITWKQPREWVEKGVSVPMSINFFWPEFESRV